MKIIIQQDNVPVVNMALDTSGNSPQPSHSMTFLFKANPILSSCCPCCKRKLPWMLADCYNDFTEQ